MADTTNNDNRRVVIELDHVRRDFQVGDETVHALKGVSFKIYEGEFVTIMGKSGSGKSTLLNQLGCLDTPSSGEYYLDGVSVRTMSRNDRAILRNRKIGFIFQNYNLVYRLTAIQNVLHGRLGYKGAVAGSLGLYSEGEKLRAFELLDEVGLGEFAYRRADQLSGGQKQRVGIARALIQDPRIILCDEPIASLDPKSSRAVMEHLRRVTRQHGITCIVNLHQVDMALEFSDRIVGLRAGEKVFEGAPAELTPQTIATIYGDDEEGRICVPLAEPIVGSALASVGMASAAPSGALQ